MGPVVSFIGAVVFGVGAGASAAYVLAVNIARVALLSAASRFLAPKIDLQQTAADKLFTVKSSIQPQAFVYGEDMLSGPLMYSNVSGGANEYLHRLVALTGREVDDFQALRIDDTDITIGTGEDLASRNADVTGGRFADVMTVATQLGTATQTVLTQLNTDFPTLWTSAHRGRGWSQLYTRAKLEGENDAYENGAPQNLRALVRGHAVYDPRLDSTRVIDSSTSPNTLGSGAHRANDPTTWAWSDNPALCLADWLMWDQVGMGEEVDRIDWELVATAADVCDELVTIPPASSPDTTQRRYTCNFTFFADQERGQIKEILEKAMLGRCIFSQGQWRMYAGAVLTATETLTAENLAGGVTLEASTAARQRYNTVRGKFVDPSRDYHANAYPEQTNAAYVTDDNGETKYRTVDFNACNNSYECQRNAIKIVRQSRNQEILRFEGNWSCFRLQIGHVVNVTLAEFSYTAKKFLITEWMLAQDGRGVDLTLVEENDSVWTDPVVGDYTTRTPTGELTPPAEPDIKLSDATITRSRVGDCYAGVRLGADGNVYYQNADGSFSSAQVPSDEWRFKGTADYYVLVTVNSGTLNSGLPSPNTWQQLNADRTYNVLRTTPGTDTANITLEITADPNTSPIVNAASATFALSATEEIAPQGDFIVADSSTSVAGTTYITAAFDFLNTGILQEFNDTISPAGYADYDGQQWHVDRPITTTESQNYGIRVNGTSGVSNLAVFNAWGYDLLTTYASTPTPWRQMSLGALLTAETAFQAGNGAGTCTVEFCNWNDSPRTVIATADYTLNPAWF